MFGYSRKLQKALALNSPELHGLIKLSSIHYTESECADQIPCKKSNNQSSISCIGSRFGGTRWQHQPHSNSSLNIVLYKDPNRADIQEITGVFNKTQNQCPYNQGLPRCLQMQVAGAGGLRLSSSSRNASSSANASSGLSCRKYHFDVRINSVFSIYTPYDWV